MAIYRIGIHYSAYAEKDIKADSEQEAYDIAMDNLDAFNFEGDYQIESAEEIKK